MTGVVVPGLPGNYTGCKIRGRFIYSDGSVVANAKWTLTPSIGNVRDAGATPKTILLGATVSGTLSSDGVIAGLDGSSSDPWVVVASSDDPDINPSGWTYKFSFTDGMLSKAMPAFSFHAPVDGDIDLADEAPIAMSNGVAIVKGDPGPVPQLSVGTVTTGTADVTITGTDTDPVLNFTLPASSSGATLTDNTDGTYALVEGTTSATVYDKATLDTALAGKVPTTRLVAGKPLSADVDIVPADIGAVSQNTLTVLAPKATGTDQLAALQTALDNAVNLKLTLALNGDHVINGKLNPASGAKIDGSRGSLRQTLDLNPAIRLTTVTGVRLTNVTVYGKTTDWVNSSSVHGAAAVYMTDSSDVQIEGGSLLGWAGDGVFIGTGCSNVHVHKVTMTGPGATYLTNTTFNYGSGVSVQPGITNWSITGCNISGFAQGTNTGDNQQDARITGNYIHDIPSQHGLYLESVNGVVIAGNIVRNTGLTGMKIQVGTTTANDPDSGVIDGNLFINVGDAGILLTNPSSVGGTPRLRRIRVTGNVISTSGADGITINNCVAVDLDGNTISSAGRHGVSITDSSEIGLSDTRITGTAWNGVLLTNVQDFTLDGVRVKNPASGDTASAEFGIQISTTCSDGTVRGCKVTDANSHMRYAYYVNSTADLTTIGFIDNIGSGATDYGYRGLSTNARAFRGNQFTGALGSMLTPPLNPTSLTVVVANGATAPAGLPDGTVIVEKSA